jgi:uncharacterized protein
MRLLYLILGFASVALGLVGTVLPLLPTVPFMLLAAFFFARSSPALERRILEHRRFGPHVLRWRERGEISRSGKRAAYAAFLASAAAGLLFLPWPWAGVPLLAAAAGGTFIATRPSAP